MLILLPPSEGKTAPTAGPRLDLGRLSLPALTSARREMLTALTTACRNDPEHTRTTLGLSTAQMAEVERNAHLAEAPSAPAGQVYSGVLYGALGLGTASARTTRRLEQWVLVWSGLWGAVRLTDPIPAYRLPGSAALPGVGRVGPFWREPLERALADLVGDQVVLDLRSGTYASTWTPPPGASVVGRVIHDRDGTRTVASHFNKATKGRLVRALAEGRSEPTSVGRLVRAIRSAGLRAELADDARGRASGVPVLDIVVDAL